MDISEALYKYLTSNEEITSLVGTKIYPMQLPQNVTLPAITYTLVLANYDSALQGDTGYTRQTIQLVTHAKTYKEARTISRLVKKKIQDLHGDMSGLFIEAVFIKSDYELSSNTSSKFAVDEYMSSIEFDFHYNEGGN